MAKLRPFKYRRKFYIDPSPEGTKTDWQFNLQVARVTNDIGLCYKSVFSLDNINEDYYCYDKFSSVAQYTIQSGDYIEYDIMWPTIESNIGLNYTCSDGSTLVNSGAIDQNNYNLNLKTDISLNCLNTWYSRKSAIPANHIGKTINSFEIGIDNSVESFSTSSSTSTTQWSDIIAVSNGSVWACVDNGDIYQKINGSDSFLPVGAGTKRWTGLTEYQNIIYACVYNGDLYYKPAAQTSFIPLGTTTRNWNGVSCNSSNGDLFACVYGGKIYKTVGGILQELLISPIQNWTGIHVYNNHVWACVENGDIYYAADATNPSFVALNQVSRNWSSIGHDTGGEIYATVKDGDIYKQTDGIGNFVAIGGTSRNWTGITYEALSSIYYSCVSGGDIYKKVPRTPAWESLATLSDVISFCVDNENKLWIVRNVDSTRKLYKQDSVGGSSFTYICSWDGLTDIAYCPAGTLEAAGIYCVIYKNENYIWEIRRVKYIQDSYTLEFLVDSISSGISYNRYITIGDDVHRVEYDIGFFGLGGHWSISDTLWTITDKSLIGIGGQHTITNDNNVYYNTTLCTIPTGATNFTHIYKRSGSDYTYLVGNGKVYKNSGNTNFVEIPSSAKTGITGYVSFSSGGITYEYCFTSAGIFTMGTGVETNFEPIGVGSSNITNLGWSDICSDLNGNIYTCQNGGLIYKQSGGIGNFVSVNNLVLNWICLADDRRTGDIYAAVNNGSIYKQNIGTPGFNVLGSPITSNKQWKWLKIDPITSDLYVSNGTDIFMKSSSTGIWSTVSSVYANQISGCFSPNGDLYIGIYSAVNGTNTIFKRPVGTSTFTNVSSVLRLSSLCSDSLGNIYAIAVESGNVINKSVYKQSIGTSGFSKNYTTSKPWTNVTFEPQNKFVYGIISTGNVIYKFKSWSFVQFLSGYIKNAKITDGAGSTRKLIFVGDEESISTTNVQHSTTFASTVNSLSDQTISPISSPLNITGLAEHPNTDVYAVYSASYYTSLSYVYKQTNGIGTFNKIFEKARTPFKSVAISPFTGNVYVSAISSSDHGNSGIYFAPNGSSSFTQIPSTSQMEVSGLAVSPVTGNIYCVVQNGQMYKSTIDSSLADFSTIVDSSLPALPWSKLTIDLDDNIYLIDNSSTGKVYKSTSGTEPFTAINGLPQGFWTDVCTAINGDVYLSRSDVNNSSIRSIYIKRRGDSTFTFSNLNNLGLNQVIDWKSICITKDWNLYTAPSNGNIKKGKLTGLECTLDSFTKYPPTETSTLLVLPEGKVKSDFSDLRFTRLDGTTLMPHWIESITDGVASVWIKLNSIPYTPIVNYSLSYENFIESDGFGLGIDYNDVEIDDKVIDVEVNDEVIDVPKMHGIQCSPINPTKYKATNEPIIEEMPRCENCSSKDICEDRLERESYLKEVEETRKYTLPTIEEIKVPYKPLADGCENCPDKDQCFDYEALKIKDEENIGTYTTKYVQKYGGPENDELWYTAWFQANGGTIATPTTYGNDQWICIPAYSRCGYYWHDKYPNWPSYTPTNDCPCYIGAGQIAGNLQIPTAPSRYQTFDHWAIKSSDQDKYSSCDRCCCPNYTVTDGPSGTVYTYTKYACACYKDKPVWTITFSANGGSGGGSVNVPADLTCSYADSFPSSWKDGYVFGGYWTVAASTGGSQVSPGETGTKFSGSTTVYARWYGWDFYVNYDTQGGSPSFYDQVRVTSPQTTLGAEYPTPNPTRTNCTFGGWYTGKLGAGIKVEANTFIGTFNPSYSSITLYAKWIGVPTASIFYMYYGCAMPANLSGSNITTTMDPGLRYFYYQNTNFATANYKGTEVSSTINYSFTSGVATKITNQSWENTLPSQPTSIRWEGWVVNRGIGGHVLYTLSKEGIKLYSPSTSLLISELHSVPSSTYYYAPSLNLNNAVSIKLEWYRDINTAGEIRLGWTPADGSGQVIPIPTTYLYCRKYAALEPSFNRWGPEERMIAGNVHIF